MTRVRPPSPVQRSFELVWNELRLVVLDIESVQESPLLSDEATEELEQAIEAVRRTSSPVQLVPRSKRNRLIQHRAIEAAGLTSASTGVEPNRAVEVRPEPAPVLLPQLALGGGKHRTVSVAVVACERGRIIGKPWQQFVNPGVPVDARTFEKHGLSDDRLSTASSSFGATTPAPTPSGFARCGSCGVWPP